MQADCLAKVTYDRTMLALLGDSRVCLHLANSDDILASAAKRCGLTRDRVHVEPIVFGSGREMLVLKPLARVREGKPEQAREFLKAYLDELGKALRAWQEKEFNRQLEEQNRISRQGAEAAAEADKYREERTKLLLELGPWHGVDVEKRLATLSERKLELELELAGLRAEVDAYARSQAVARVRAKQLAKDDAMLKNLREIVALREKQYVNTEKLVKSGHASGAGMAADKEAWLKAQVDVARREEELAQAAAGVPQAGELSRQREILSITLARKQAELAEVDRRLKALSDPKLLKSVRKVEQLDRELKLVERQHQRLTLDAQSLHERISRLEPVSVTVIGAKEPERSRSKATRRGSEDVNRSEP